MHTHNTANYVHHIYIYGQQEINVPIFSIYIRLRNTHIYTIMAHSLNYTSSNPSILNDTEPESWIAVGARLCMVQVIYVTMWNRFYPTFFTTIKNVKTIISNWGPQGMTPSNF